VIGSTPTRAAPRNSWTFGSTRRFGSRWQTSDQRGEAAMLTTVAAATVTLVIIAATVAVVAILAGR
jgi:hypothetical protein